MWHPIAHFWAKVPPFALRTNLSKSPTISTWTKMSNRFTVCVMLKKERYRRSETLSRSGKQECTTPISRRTKKSTISRSQITGNPSDVSLTDTCFSSRSFLSRFRRWCCPIGGSAVRRLICYWYCNSTSNSISNSYSSFCSCLFTFVSSGFTAFFTSLWTLFAYSCNRTTNRERTKKKELGREFMLSQL